MSFRRLIHAIGLLSALVLGCGGEPPPAADVIVRIEGEEIHYSELERYLERNALGSDAALGGEVMSRLLDQLIDERLLLRLAKDEGLAPEGGEPREILERLLEGLEPSQPTRAEIEAYYRENVNEFRLEERVRLRQLLLMDESLAERIRGEWLAGVPFDALVGRYSESIAAYQSDGETLAREDLPAVLAETIFELEPGEVSQVVTADYGFHLFQVTRRLPAEALPVEVAAAEIRERLARHRRDLGVDDLLLEAGERYNVRVFRGNIPFNYDGDH